MKLIPAIHCFFVAASGGFLIRIASIFSLLMSTRALSPFYYARLSLILSAVQVAITVCGMGLRQSLALDYMHCNGNSRYDRIGQTIAWYCLILLFFIPLFIFLVITHIIPLSLSEAYTVGCIIGGTFFIELLYQYLQYEQKVYFLITVQCISSVAIVLFSYIFLFVYHHHHEGILYAQTIAYSLVTALALRILSTLPYQVSFKKIITTLPWTQLYDGLPFVPAIIFNWLICSGNRWILATYLSCDDVSNYALADTVSQLFQSCILVPWSISYLPTYLSTCVKNPTLLYNHEVRNRKIMIAAMLTCTFFVFFLYAIIKPLVPFILPPLYRRAYPLALPIACAQIFLFGSYFASCTIQFLKKKYFMAFSLFLPASTQMFLAYCCVHRWGTFGCAYASVVSYALYWVLTCLYAHYLVRSQETALSSDSTVSSTTVSQHQ